MSSHTASSSKYAVTITRNTRGVNYNSLLHRQQDEIMTVSMSYSVEHVAGFKHTGLQTDRDFVISRVITGGAGRMYTTHYASGAASKQSFRQTSCVVTRHSARHFAAA